MANIEEYTNDELQTSLREHGMNVPVTPTTRKVCENKLRKLIAQSGGQQTVIPQTKDSDSPINFSRYEDDRESTPQLPEDKIIHRRNLPSAQRQKEYNRQNHSEPDQSDEDPGETSVRELTPQEQRQFKVRSREQRNGSFWKYVGLALFALIFISFLVFLNRNAQNINDEI